MCTAVGYNNKDFYFGRTLDYEISFGEEVVITPRNFTLNFKNGRKLNRHYAIIGIAHIVDGYPLYYDGVNEKGLATAALNFVGNAVYRKDIAQKENIAHFEVIPYILSQCDSVKKAREYLKNINITDLKFNADLPVARLHWIISDKKESITLEAVEDGIKVYDNPVGVLTNNPPFEMQMFQLNNYMHLSNRQPENLFCKNLPLSYYSRGMGALGLPGDLSSVSRFIRASFVKMNSVSGNSEDECVSQFFHILGSVEQQRGCCSVGDGKFEITVYTSCCNADRGIYYYTTYENHQISAISMHKTNLEGSAIISYALINKQKIKII